MSGAAIGGFGVGLAQGLKLGTDIVDSAARREVMGKQAKLADLEIQQKEKDVQLQNKMDALWTGAGGVAPQAASQPPAPDQPQASAAPSGIATPATAEGTVPTAGIATPTTDATQATGSAAPAAGVSAPATAKVLMSDGKPLDYNNMSHMREMSTRASALLAAAGKLSAYQIAQQSINWEKLEAEGAWRAAEKFRKTGNSDEALALFNKSGMSLPEGTKFAIEKTSLYPGAPAADNVVVTTPDGRRFDSNSLLRGAMDIKEIATHDLTLARDAADIKVKLATLGETNRSNTAREGLQADANLETRRSNLNNESLKAFEQGSQDEARKSLASYHDQIAQLTKVQKNLALEQQAQKIADEQATKSAKMLAVFSGINLNTTEKTVQEWEMNGDKKALAAHYNGLRMHTSALQLRQLNLGADGRQLFSDADLIGAVKGNATGVPVFDADKKLWTVDYMGKKMYVPAGAGNPDAKFDGSAAATPQSTAPKAGIAPPPPLPPGLSLDVETRAAGIRDTEAAAQAQQQAEAAAAKAKKDQLTTEVGGLTPDRIRALTGKEAREMESRYWQVLTSDQKLLIRRQANLP